MHPSPPHFTPPLYSPYQNSYQPQLSGPHDHELKKQYLNLLPPQQIIEICLTFDIHVPIYIRNSVWPPDIHAAIVAIQKSSGTNTGNGTNNIEVDGGSSANDQTSSSKPDELPVMSSLAETPDSSQTGVSQQDAPADPRPPDKPDPSSTLQPQTPGLQSSSSQLTSSASDSTTTVADTPTPTTAVPPSSAPAPTPMPATAPTPAAPLTTIPPSVPQTPFPHQPYGYPQAHYPHAPYYQHSGYPGYPPSSSYHPYPLQIPGAYPGFPQPNPIFANPALNPAVRPQESFNAMANDDLPSYEEMIVEALMDCTDPEGRAPKDLFAWMASKYPLQSNFRPSASQALQKAFKRGRFEKTTGGKYRLNATWEGGNTSRRTTRRPQTQSQTQSAAGASSAGPGSLFTHAPLVHQHQPSPVPHQAPPYPTPPYPYMYPHQPPPPGYPPYPHLPQPLLPPPQQQQQTPASTESQPSLGVDGRTSSDTADAYEAAQNILKAINFGELLKLPPEPVDGTVGSSSTESSAEKLATLTDGTVMDDTGVIAQQQQQQQAQAAALPPQSLARSMHPSAITPEISTAARSTVDNTRAELQAQLALLAAQLTEYALESEDDGQAQTTTMTMTTATHATQPFPVPPSQPPPSSALAGHFPIQNPLSSFSVVPPFSNSLQDPSLIPPGPTATSMPAPAVPANPLPQTHGDQPPSAERKVASPLSMTAEPEEEEESDDDMEEVI